MEYKKLGNTDVDIPVLGMGTWNIAPPDSHAPHNVDEEGVIRALRRGIELGMTHIDAAEMYGDGRAEELVGRAIKGMRDKVFIATKVEPEHFHYRGVLNAARGSLKRLGTDYIDLYMLHWPSSLTPISETMSAMEKLVDDGIVRFIGVSNFTVPELKEAQGVLNKCRIAANQVKYNLVSRGIEKDLLACAVEQSITITAYSPFNVGKLFGYSGRGIDTVHRLAREYQKTFAQVCLNWLIAREPVITIPKSVQVRHVEENAGAAGWRMESEAYQAIDEAFASYLIA